MDWVFILIGLQLPSIITNMGVGTMVDGIKYGLIISLIAILIRIIYVFPIAYVPIWLGNLTRVDRGNPPWKAPVIVGWAGMRGVVSLASALSIPLLMKDGTDFPQRSLILFITFIVILVTLVFQGLTLPLVIKWVNIKDSGDFLPVEEQDAAIHLRLMEASLKRLNEKYQHEMKENELVGFLKNQLESDISIAGKRLESLECGTTDREEVELYNSVLLDLYDVQRKELFVLRHEKIFSDEELRKMESELDFDEAKISLNRD
jgi:NhaP-type Na+/H+ and K+/H+ antiporter